MANTVTGYTNSIALAERFLPILDEVYKRESITSRLDMANERVRFIGANTVQLYKTQMGGLGAYSRNNGFLTGDAQGTWEALTLTQDRGRSFMVDVMDNDETLGMAFGTLAGEFIRTQVVPELDAYRFATYASNAGLTASKTLATGDNVADFIDTAEAAMGDAEVPVEGRMLFVSEAAYKQLKGNITRYLANESGVNRNVEMYNGMEVIRVPQGRFNTAITVNAAPEGYSAGFTATGKAINFMIVHPSAVVQVVKHVIPRIFSPEVNQLADAWKLDYRIYHDAFVEDNKVNGIYLHSAV